MLHIFILTYICVYQLPGSEPGCAFRLQDTKQIVLATVNIINVTLESAFRTIFALQKIL